MLATLVFMTTVLQIDDPVVKRNIAYVEHGTKEQVFDLWKPNTEMKGTVVFVYGGGWHAPRGKDVDEVARALVKEGYACALISHRLGPQDKFPAQIEDLAAAVAFLRNHQELGAPKKTILVGHSSGAHLCLLLVSEPKYLAGHKMAQSDFCAVVGLSTPTDLRPKHTHTFADALMAGRGAETFNRDEQLMSDASPATRPESLRAATLLVVGDHDMPGLAADATAYQTAHKGVELMIVKDCDHMGTVHGVIDKDSPVHARVFGFMAKALR